MTVSPPSGPASPGEPFKAPPWLYVAALIFVAALFLSPRLRGVVLGPDAAGPRGGVAENSPAPSLPGTSSPAPSAPSIDRDPGGESETSVPADQAAERKTPADADKTPSSGPLGKFRKPDNSRTPGRAPADSTRPEPESPARPPGSEPPFPKGAPDRTAPRNQKNSPPDEAPAGPKLGVLTEVRKGVLQSTAGLIYRRGSVDGHRLDHVLEHSRDNLDKPIHGVFLGDREEILAVIDEGYQIAQKRGPPIVRKEEEGDRTVYLVDMKRKIGYLGGQVGDRKNHPACRLLRLVLEENEVITAFPTDR